MAENDRCDKRWVWSEMCGEDYHDTFVDHHEWRFLREFGVGGEPKRYTFYCIFCLKIKAAQD